ncbi:MAG: protein-methionine-sulfoxide reductase catalytic subunit MsrP [Acidobacteriota bacterium]
MAYFHFPPAWSISAAATPESVFVNRRQVVSALGLGSLALAAPTWARPQSGDGAAAGDAAGGVVPNMKPALERFGEKFPAQRNKSYGIGDLPLTPESIAAQFNNFYEFTTTKDRVWELAQDYRVDPWKVEVKGLVKRPQTLDLDDIMGRFPLEERLYRFRCVERWAMQVPWTGYPLRKLIDALDPLPSAKWVRFVSVLDKQGLPGQRKQSYYPWPYYEALRMDEARHDLAFLVVGSYGHALPMQHGAPWRLACPWKYGYKSPKSIVEIEFTDQQPGTFWNDLQEDEYGFYSNVEPHKPHPRWSQKWEQDIGTGETRDSELYNGYAELVGSMYTGDEV